MSLHHVTTFAEYAQPTQCTHCATLEDPENTPLNEVGKHDLSCSDSCTSSLLYKACTASGQKDLKTLYAALYLLQEVQLERIPLEDYTEDGVWIGELSGAVQYHTLTSFRETAMTFLKQFGEPGWAETISEATDELREKLGVSL